MVFFDDGKRSAGSRKPDEGGKEQVVGKGPPDVQERKSRVESMTDGLSFIIIRLTQGPSSAYA